MTTNCPACGTQIKGRSVPDHRRLFALISAAYDNWPEHHRFKPDNKEHLRAWLCCAAKYRNVVIVERPPVIKDGLPKFSVTVSAFTFDNVVAELLAAFRKMGTYAWTFPHEDGCLLVTPKSMAFDKLDRTEFGELRDAIEHVIETEIGVKADQLIRERAA